MFGIGGIGVWIGHGLAEPTGESRLAGVAGVGDDTDRLVEVDGDNPMQRGRTARACPRTVSVFMSVSGRSISAGSTNATPTATASVARISASIDSRREGAIRFESSTSAGRATGSASTAAATIGPSTALAGLVDAEVHASLLVSNGVNRFRKRSAACRTGPFSR